MPKQLNVNLAFTADTGAAKAQIKSLEQDLKNLMSATGPTKDFPLTKELAQAKEAAGQLRLALQNATTSTGSLDLSKFDQAIKASGMKLSEYRERLSAMGPAGQQAFAKMAQSIVQAEVPLRRTNALLDQFKTTLMNTARWQLSSSMLHGFMGALQSAYGYAQDLNSSLNNIRIVTGASVEEMTAFADRANKAAQALSTSTTQYTDAALIYYQQGIRDQEEIAGRTETTIKLANVSRQSAEEVSQQMTAIWNNFYDGSKSLEYYADAITALGATTASSSQEIATGLEKFAAISKTVGLSYEYATAALATITAQTRQSADTVGTGLRTLFSRLEGLKLGETLEDGVDLNKYSQALEAVGVQVLDVSGEMRNMDDILDDLGDRWDDLTQAQKVALAQTVGGVRQYTNLIALMDNWDKMQQNVLTAQGSEGTLQEQADIYAESWEAAQKRVKAAAQALYSDLLDDKFFINLTNGFANVLKALDGFIDGIGGLKTVLPGVAALLMNAFGPQLAKSIDNTIFNMQRGTQQMKDFYDQKKQEAMQEASLLYSNPESMADQAAQAGLEKQLELTYQLEDVAKNLSEEELHRLQTSIDIVSGLNDQAIALGKVADKAKQAQEAQSDTLVHKAISAGNTAEEKQANMGGAERLLSSVSQKASLGTEGQDRLEKLNSLYEKGVISVERYQKSVAQLKTHLLNNGFSESSAAIQSLNQILSASPQYVEEFDNVVQELVRDKGFESQVYIDNEASLQAMAKEYEWTKEDIRSFLEQVQNAINSGKNAKEAIASAADAVNNVKEKINAAAQATQQLGTTGQTIISTFQAISQITMGIMALSNAINTLKDPDASNWEKFRSVLMGVSMAAPSLINGFGALAKQYNLLNTAIQASTASESKNLVVKGLAKVATALHIPLKHAEAAAEVESATGSTVDAVAKKEEAIATTEAAAANTGFLASLGPLLPVLLAIAAAIGVVAFVISGLIKAAHEDEKAIERANQAVNDLTEASNEANQKAQDLKSTIDSYDSCREKLDQCTKGTQEWRDALKETGTAALEVIDKVGEFLNKDEYDQLLDEYRTGKGLNEDLLELAQQRADAVQIELNHAKNLAEYEATQANLQYQQKNLTGNIVSQTKGTTLADDADSSVARAIQEHWQELAGTLDAQDLKNKLEKLGVDVSNLDNSTLNQWRTQIDNMSETASKAADELKMLTSLEIEEFLANSKNDTEYDEAAKAYAAEQQVQLIQQKQDEWIQRMSDEMSQWDDSSNALYQEILAQLQAKGYDWSEDSNGVRGDDSERTLAFRDANGQLMEFSDKYIASLLAAGEGLDEVVNHLDEAQNLLKQLSGAGEDFAKSVMTGFKDGNFDLSDFTKTLTSEQLQSFKDATKESLLDTLDMTEDELDELAKLYGTTSNKLIKELQNSAKNGFDQFNKLGDDLSAPVKTAYEKLFADLKDITLEDAETLANDMQNIFVKTKGDMEQVKEYADFYSQLGDKADEFNEKIADIDWQNATIDDLQGILDDLGIEAEFANDKLYAILKTLGLIHEEDVDELTPEERYSKVTEATAGLSAGEAISDDNYKILEQAGFEVEKYFAKWADGQYHLITSSEALQQGLEASNTAMGGFTQRLAELEAESLQLKAIQADENFNYEDYQGKANTSTDEGMNQAATQAAAVSAFTEESGIDPTELAEINALLAEGVELSNKQERTLAKAYDNLGDTLDDEHIAERLQEIEEEAGALSEEMENSKFFEGVDPENYEALADMAEWLENGADGMDELSKEVKGNSKEAKRLANEYMRFNEAMDDVNENYDDWMKELKHPTAKNHGTTIKQLRKTYQDLLGTSIDLSDAFCEETDNLEDLEKAANGDEEAYNRLRDAAAQDIIGQIAVDDEQLQNLNNDYDYIKNYMENNDIQVGASIEDEQFLAACQEMVNAATAAGLDASDALTAMGVDVELNEAEGVTVDTKEAVGWDAHATSVDISAEVPDIHQSENGGVSASTKTVHGSFPQISVSPQPESETEEKHTTIVAPKVVGARKAAGGGTKFNQSGGGGGSCFVAGTIISTHLGFIPIEQIQPGNIVLSYNEYNQQNEYSKVLQTMIHLVLTNLYTLYIDNEIIKVTGVHRFYIKRAGMVQWIPANELRAGDLMYFASGEWKAINQIYKKKVFKKVYNFEVANNHNYYVSSSQILAHNKGGCFIAGTLITTQNGFKNIELIHSGDIVLSYNEEKQQNEYSMVKDTMIHYLWTDLYTLYIQNERIKVTDIHRFYILRNGKIDWIPASKIQISDLVLFANGSWQTIDKIVKHKCFRKVYNFEVCNNHNYYVGNNQILVHNKGCFTAGTLITTSEGFKNIEDIKIDDIVLSYNEQTQQNEYSEVVQTMIHFVRENIYTLYIENEQLRATGIHRFFILRNNSPKWIHAKDLHIGDLVLFADGIWHKIWKIDINFEFQTVYNFEVSNTHNYYVGNNRILAHNKGCFVAGTLITTNHGFEKIENIQTGDIVLSYNEELKVNEYSEVLQTMIHNVEETIYTLYIGTEKIRATGIHRFYILRNNKLQWIHAENLQVGDFILLANGDFCKIWHIQTNLEVQTVYNFEVSNNHNYYVGKIQALAHNKGGGSRPKRERAVRAQTKRPDEGKERYHVVLKNMEQINAQLDKISTAYDRAFGKSKLKLLDDQIKKQEELIKNQKKYVDEIKEYQKADKKNLQKGTKEYWSEVDQKTKTVKVGASNYLGKDAEFDANGVLTNYDKLIELNNKKYNEAVEAYNKKDAELVKKLNKTTKEKDREKIEKQREAAKKILEEAEAQYEGFNEYLQQYEDTTSLLLEQEQEYINQQNELYDMKLEKTTISVKIKVDVADDKLKLLNNLFEQLGDKAYNAAKRISLIGQQLQADQFKVDAYKKGIAEIFENHGLKNGDTVLNDFFSGKMDAQTLLTQMSTDGSGNHFTEAEAEYFREAADAALEYNSNAMEMRTRVIEEIGNIMDENADKLNRITDKMEYLKDVANSYKNIVDLTGRQFLGINTAMYDAMERTNVNLAKQSLDMAKDRKKQAEDQYEFLLRRYAAVQDELSDDEKDQWKERIKQAEDSVQEMTQNFYSSWEDAIEAVNTRFDSMMTNMADDFSRAMAGAAGNLEGLSKNMDLKKDVANVYLPSYERIYQLTKLTNDAQKAIDQSNNVKVQKELEKVQQKILDAKKSGNELSKYDIDFLTKELELKKAQMALEEAQQVKSQVRMTRDSEGNYSYVYTADETAVEDAESEYNAKLYEMQKLNEEYINSLQEQLVGLEQNYISAIQEAANIYGKGTDEYKTAVESINSDYQQYFNNLNQQMNNALENQSTTQEEHAKIYEELTGDLEQANAKVTTSWEETMLYSMTGFETLAEYQTAWAESTEEVLSTVLQANEDWQNDMESIYEAAGTSIDEFEGNTANALMNVNAYAQETAAEMDAMVTATNEALAEVVNTVVAWEEEYSAVIDANIEKNNEFVASVNDLLAAWSGVSEIISADALAAATETVDGLATQLANAQAAYEDAQLRTQTARDRKRRARRRLSRRIRRAERRVANARRAVREARRRVATNRRKLTDAKRALRAARGRKARAEARKAYNKALTRYNRSRTRLRTARRALRTARQRLRTTIRRASRRQRRAWRTYRSASRRYSTAVRTEKNAKANYEELQKRYDEAVKAQQALEAAQASDQVGSSEEETPKESAVIVPGNSDNFTEQVNAAIDGNTQAFVDAMSKVTITPTVNVDLPGELQQNVKFEKIELPNVTTAQEFFEVLNQLLSSDVASQFTYRK